ncbi:MAG: MaoC family dehydratase [Elusimicrobiota bacterium]
MQKSKTIDQISVGDTESVEVELNEDKVEAFARATGDYNPLHMEDEYAKESQFGSRIVHGVLLTGIISGMLGTRLPGLGTIAREMSAKFSQPAYIGETVTATIELVKKKERLNMCIFKYKVTNEAEKIVVRGKAKVIAPQKSKKPE